MNRMKKGYECNEANIRDGLKDGKIISSVDGEILGDCAGSLKIITGVALGYKIKKLYSKRIK